MLCMRQQQGCQLASCQKLPNRLPLRGRVTTDLVMQRSIVLPDTLHLQSMRLPSRLARVPVRRLRRRHLLLVPQAGVLQPLLVALLGLQARSRGWLTHSLAACILLEVCMATRTPAAHAWIIVTWMSGMHVDGVICLCSRLQGAACPC
jgi:hypothetical protein